MVEIRPTFIESDFLFRDDTKPDHEEGNPAIPTYVGMYSVLGARGADQLYVLAEDIETEELADLIAEARVRRLHKVYGDGQQSENVFVGDPFGTLHLKFIGRPV